MEEILKQDKSKSHKEFEKLLSEDLGNRKFKEGEIATGTVEEIGKKFIFIDLGLKSSGAIPLEEFKLSGELNKISVGSKVDVLLERIENKNGEIVISREKARRAKAWKKMEAAFEGGAQIKGIITGRVKGGFVVNVESCLCFLPASQLDLRPLKNFDHLMKTPQTFECVKLDKKRGNIVLSRRAVIEKIRNKDKNKIISKLKEGDIVNGIVKNITDWGVFVDLNGVDSLLHITDISWSRINKPSELLSLGQSIKVKIIKIELSKLKISVSIKHLSEDPYATIINKYKIGSTYPAVVTKVQEYGCFARLEEGLEGLIHQSELSWTKKNIHPGKILSTSQKIEVQLLEKDLEKRRLSLSYKNTIPNPWAKFIKDHKVGGIYEGSVKNVTDYGLFLSIKDTEFDGLCHYKDENYEEDESELKKYKKGQTGIKFRILEINQQNEKIRLGIKQLKEDSFETFRTNHKVGDIITAVVHSSSQSGVYVNVGKKNFSILIKKNQLAKEPENQRPARFVRGDKLDAVITELEKDDRKVVLSIKKLEEREQLRLEEKYGSKDSGGVLGDIFNFGSLKKEQKNKK